MIVMKAGRRPIKHLSSGKYNIIFQYFYLNGGVIKDTKTLDYIKSIHIPPAYQNVEIDLNPHAKIRAFGYDDAGRKQYLYNPNFVAKKEREKYCSMISFGQALPTIKQDINKILQGGGGINDCDKLVALVLRIILACNFRIGNESCRKSYNSFGVTTLQKQHLKFNGTKDTIIDFIGKKGVQNICAINDPMLKRMLHQIHRKADGKKANLFTYIEPSSGHEKTLTSSDVNIFLKRYGDFSSKDFRTWIANESFMNGLIHTTYGGDDSDVNNRKKIARNIIKQIAENLHHTPAVCQKKYIDPQLIDIYINDPKKFERIIGSEKDGGKAFIRYVKSGSCKL